MLRFVPNTLASLQLPGATLFAAGGQDAELHLSLHTPTSLSPGDSSSDPDTVTVRKTTQCVWSKEHNLQASINNSVTFTSSNLNLARSHDSKVEPRVVVSNNNGTVRFFDIGTRSRSHTLDDAGTLKLGVAVNHSSVSPDGRTLLSVGDSSQVFLHNLSGSSRLTFTPVSTLTLPAPSPSAYGPVSTIPASFSTAFSPNGTKFAVASQEGMVVVWDVRSSKPFKVYESDKSRLPSWCRSGSGLASGYLYDDPWDWARGGARAPGWGFRCVKFNDPVGHGRELMTFTEHTSVLHVVDARTFETEEIIHVPKALNAEPLASAARTSPTVRPRTRAADNSSSLVHRSASRSSSTVRSSSSPLPRIVVFSNSPPESARSSFSDAREDRRRAREAIEEHLAETARIRHRLELEERRRFRERIRALGDSSASEDEGDHEVVIPPFGNFEEEEQIRRILVQQGVRARTTREVTDGEGDMEVDPDGEDFDVDACFSSREPSRESSPVSALPIHVPMPVQSAYEASDTLQVPSGAHSARDRLVARVGRLASARRHARRNESRQDSSGGMAEQDMDLAGVCFDPSGSWLYVASTNAVVEWSVRGTEKRWWYGSEWA